MQNVANGLACGLCDDLSQPDPGLWIGYVMGLQSGLDVIFSSVNLFNYLLSLSIVSNYNILIKQKIIIKITEMCRS